MQDIAWNRAGLHASVGRRATPDRAAGEIDLNRRTFKAIRDMERRLLDEGKPVGEVAAALEARFGLPFSAADIGRREVWWRLDDIAHSGPHQARCAGPARRPQTRSPSRPSRSSPSSVHW
jgi:hypothetical protein